MHCVEGDAGNIKITFPDDLFLAERLLAKAAGTCPAAASRTPATAGCTCPAAAAPEVTA